MLVGRHLFAGFLVCLVAGIALPWPGMARALDTAVAALCTAPMAAIEVEHRIPVQLLEAIGMVESGRWDEAAKRTRPWPWTVYSEGRGHRLATKAEAIAMVEGLRARGVRNIDIGCMQINFGYHGKHFASLDEMFEPAANIGYAATFLASLKQRRRSWSQAVRFYHSATPEHARPYYERVTKAWTEARRHAAEARRLARLEAYKERRERIQRERALRKQKASG